MQSYSQIWSAGVSLAIFQLTHALHTNPSGPLHVHTDAINHFNEDTRMLSHAHNNQKYDRTCTELQNGRSEDTAV